VLVPISWAILAALFALSHQFLEWPDPESGTPLIYIALAISLVPLVLVLVDFIASRRAVVDIRGVKVDFSQMDMSPAMRPSFIKIPDNIGIPGTIVPDSTPMQIASALQQATADEVVIIDIKDGHAWWATRLLALSAGAARAGMPKALAFVGVKQNVGGAFLGWAEPATVLEALLADKDEYRIRYNRASKIAQQLALFGDPDLRPSVELMDREPDAAKLVAHQNVRRYSNDPRYTKLGEAAFEQIFMEQLAMDIRDGVPSGSSLEDPPDRLTLGRLHQLLEHCLYTDAIDLDTPNKAQIASLLDSQAPYVALVRHRQYESLLRHEAGERSILRELLAQIQQSA
jgi:hypothetical protein